MKANKLDWDSAFFGIEIGKVEVRTTKEFSLDILKKARSKFDLLYVFSKSDISSVIGLSAMDVKVIFELHLKNGYAGLKKLNRFNYTNSGYNELLDLVYLSGKFSRFNLDKSFSDESFRRLYKAWIDNSLSPKFNGRVFVKLKEDKIAGFVTVEEYSSMKSRIGLIAVNPKFQGIGIAKELIQSVISFSIEKGHETLQVATQDHNYPAKKLYTSSGFTLKTKTNIYHYWI